MTLTYVLGTSNSHYAVYRDADGSEVFLGQGPGIRRLSYAEHLDVPQLWQGFDCDYMPFSPQARHAFLTFLRSIVIYPEAIDDVRYCVDCGDVGWMDDYYGTDNGDVCESCRDSYYYCHHCEELFRETRTIGDYEVCDSCTDRYYTYCDHCDDYYHDDYSSDHNHDGDGCCESPAMDFVVRNDGAPLLASDTEVTITLPSGVIDAEGIMAIRQYVRQALIDAARESGSSTTKAYDICDAIESIGAEWQRRDGNYTKRLSRMAYKDHGVKLPADVISRVGNIASDHSRAVDFRIAVTRDLNQSAEDFYHDGSCWWGSYSESRCALKTSGGYGLRSFNDREVTGRAWVMPLRVTDSGALVPTFDALNPDAFVVFNGYGDLGGYSPARIVAHMAGMTYRKITFTCEPMYVNGSAGYLVAPEDLASQFTDSALRLSVDQHSDLYYREQGSVYNVA